MSGCALLSVPIHLSFLSLHTYVTPMFVSLCVP